MPIVLEFGEIVDGLRGGKFGYSHLVESCAHVQTLGKANSKLDKLVKAVLDSKRISVISLLEQCYEKAYAYAEEIRDILVDIKDGRVATELLESFAQKKDFDVVIKFGKSKRIYKFLFPFDTRENIITLKKLLLLIRNIGEKVDMEIAYNSYRGKRKENYLTQITDDLLDNFEYEISGFLDGFFKGRARETNEFKKGKTIRFKFVSVKGIVTTEDISNDDDTITLHRKVQIIQQIINKIGTHGETGEYTLEIVK